MNQVVTSKAHGPGRIRAEDGSGRSRFVPGSVGFTLGQGHGPRTARSTVPRVIGCERLDSTRVGREHIDQFRRSIHPKELTTQWWEQNRRNRSIQKAIEARIDRRGNEARQIDRIECERKERAREIVPTVIPLEVIGQFRPTRVMKESFAFPLMDGYLAVNGSGTRSHGRLERRIQTRQRDVGRPRQKGGEDETQELGKPFPGTQDEAPVFGRKAI